MSKSYLDFLKSFSKKFCKEHGLFDIVLYGSAVKGKLEPGDVDVLLVFTDKKLTERTDISHDFKKALSKKIKNLDVKSINLEELFDNSFLARQGVLIEGQSLVEDSPIAERLGFEGSAIFTHSLKNLNHNSKTKFTYALIGRDNKIGIIKETKSKLLGKGVVMTPIKNSLIFENFLKKWNVKYEKKNVLVSLL